jgi:hypothetical protein
MGVLPMARWLPAAAAMIVPRRAAWFSASSNLRSLFGDGCATPMLKLMMRAPASTHSAIASAVSSLVAVGMPASFDPVSRKIGLTRSAQPGQMDGASEPRRAASIPATNVAWAAAVPSAPRAPAVAPGSVRMLAAARSGWSATGPSIKAMVIAAEPALTSIKRRRPTTSNT